MDKNRKALILHGGAGRIEPELAEKKLPVLEQARDAAWEKLKVSGSAEEAVVEALSIMEASEYFNAGYGGYPDQRGQVSLDAGLMRGNGDFAAVMFARQFIHPSKLLLERLRPGYRRLSVWTEEDATWLAQREDRGAFGWKLQPEEMIAPYIRQMKKEQFEVLSKGLSSTVGCVARNAEGRIVAGTSTGGVAQKAHGRVGDSPIPGHGYFADDRIGGLSTTGQGEAFLSAAATGFVLAGIRGGQEPKSTLEKELAEIRFGQGGIIFLPAKGQPVYALSAPQMAVASSYFSATGEEIESALIAGT